MIFRPTRIGRNASASTSASAAAIGFSNDRNDEMTDGPLEGWQRKAPRLGMTAALASVDGSAAKSALLASA